MIFFQKIELSTTSQVLRKWSFNLHDDCQKTLCNLQKCCLKFAILGIEKKMKPTFFSGKITVFSKSCFYQSFRSERGYLITCTKTVQKPSKLLYVTFCGLSYLIIRQKKAWVFLSLEEKPFFQKLLFSTNSWLLMKWSYNLKHNC